MKQSWERFSEPRSTTLLRTTGLALAVGVGAGLYQRRLVAVPITTLLALWFTLGGHYVEILFRNGLRPLIAGQVLIPLLVRLVIWFVGGSALYAGALATRALLTGHRALPWPWWAAGALFVAAELLIHLLMRARRQPSVYDGLG